MPTGGMDTSKWWRYKDLRKLNLLLIFPLLSIFSQGFDGSMMNGLQAVTEWRNYFGAPKGAVLGLFNAAYPLGGVIGVFFIPIVSDRWGRKAGLAFGAAVSVLGGALQAGSVNLAMFVIARLLLGVGCIITAGVGAPFVTEIAHPSQRTTATALFLTFYSFGSIIAGWATFGTFRITNSAAWRIPSGLQVVPSAMQLLGVWWVPESPRWLVSRGRSDEAWKMIVKYHGDNNENDELAVFEFEEIQLAVNNRVESKHKGIRNDLNNLHAFIKTPGNRKRLAILVWAALISQLSGNAFVSYYLSPILASVGLKTDLQQTLINATSQMVSWFSALYFATLSGKLGRRTLFLWSLAAIWICDICITIGSALFQKDGNKAAGYSVVVFLYLFSPAYNLGLNGNLGLYISEIAPFELRTTGLAIFYFSQQCFNILSSFTTPIGLENIKWKFYIIFVGWVMVEFAVVWLLFPETKGPSLEDIAALFDGPREHGGEKLDLEALESKIPAQTHTAEQVEKI
ncbi:general substrate transporter [Leptodontidium sp. MPI-SDFR-AT-0119]|nr:general substrate transporter [Leptodontidium sp. MPI-SDFR-AT-0119]